MACRDAVLVVAGGEEGEPHVPCLGREVLICDLAFRAGTATGVVGAFIAGAGGYVGAVLGRSARPRNPRPVPG